MAASEKRCLYEVLGLAQDCTSDEIRSAYRKLALQRHPDKLIQSGVSEPEATASFQELVNAYEVLSDPRERAWYDSHRSQILFSSNSSPKSSNSYGGVGDLFGFFSNSAFSGYSDLGKGFYKVYGDLFDKVYANELNFARKLGLGLPKEAPVMGNLQSLYAQVTAFYNYWLGFVTVMDFCWVDQYDAMAGPNRKSRRVMEEENKKLRKKARREYNETVRGLAEFVKKRDKRVIDMQVKRNEETEKKKEEERERKRRLERERAERAKVYEEPDWAKVEELDDGEVEEVEDERRKGDGKELYCVACGKKFRSEKQWKNHEQSKKHKEKVAELREAFVNEETENEAAEDEDVEEEVVAGDGVDASSFISADDGVDELRQQFDGHVRIEAEESVGDEGQSSEEEGSLDIDNDGDCNGVGEKLGMDEDEARILEAMVSGHKTKKNKGTTINVEPSLREVDVDVDVDEADFMEYNNRKSNRRNKGRRREKGRKDEEASRRVDEAEINSQAEDNNGHYDRSQEELSSSFSTAENETSGKGDDRSERNQKATKQAIDKRGTTKKDTNPKSKNASKGRNQKASSKNSGNVCDKCGEEFESRNKLHKHLGDTGHAAFKSR